MSNIDNIFGEMEEKAKLDSDFFTIRVGKNPVRVLSDFVKVENIFKGQYPNSKYKGILTAGYQLASDEAVTMQGWAWIIDRETGELKIGQFGKNILGAIVALKKDPEYAFGEFPMPYDITISNTGEGASRYSVIAARTNTPVTDAEMAALNKKKSIADIVAAIVDKQNKPAETANTTVYYPESNIKAEDIFPE